MADEVDYNGWSHQDLIKRVTTLEAELNAKNVSLGTFSQAAPRDTHQNARAERQFVPERYNTRLIALKLAYLGKNYCGFEYTGGKTPLPTIEEELWKALNKARLIFPHGTNPLSPGEVNWEGCDYSKCGRTDKGVSAFGQVIGLRVRSNRPRSKKKAKNRAGESEDLNRIEVPSVEDMYNTAPRDGGLEVMAPPLSPEVYGRMISAEIGLSDPDLSDSLNFDPVLDELPYPHLLNKLLPPDIRILAWCPFPPVDFSARFSCRERQYKYFFTQPAFAPIPHNLEQENPSTYPKTVMKDGWLNIEAMREAARYFEGVHDFRNFCKVDAKKQIFNYERKIYRADIEEVPDHTGALAYINQGDFLPAKYESPVTGEVNPRVYSFVLHGSAFLWHQVRHMVAVLFLVGQGLEAPSIVPDLLAIEKTPGRPMYDMATDGPLVLWNCIFPREDDPEREDALQWHYIGQNPDVGDAKFGNEGLMEDLWKMWRERKVDELLAGSLLGIVAEQAEGNLGGKAGKGERKGKSQKIFDGSSGIRGQGKYIPIMQKRKVESVEELNRKWAVKMGFENSEEMKELGFRRLKKEKEEVVDEGDE